MLKKIFKYLLLLLACFVLQPAKAQCIIDALAHDLLDANTPQAFKDFIGGNPEGMMAYKKYLTNPHFRTDVNTLNATSNFLTKHSDYLAGNPGKFDNFLQNLKGAGARCSTCPPVAGVHTPPLHQAIDEMDWALEAFKNGEVDIKKLFTEMATSTRKAESGAYTVSELKNVLGTGGRALEDGNVIKLFSKNGVLAAHISDGKLLPKKYYQSTNTNATPLGQPRNGYQVYKEGDDLMVKRVPDKSPYSSSELADLYAHPEAHVLERHGHDVIDEALVTRSETPSFAPDGQRRNNPPSHSSKFESPDKLKEALNNTKPGSANWSPPATGDFYTVTYPPTGNASSAFGYGIPAGGGSPVQMYKVIAVYRKHGGVWKLYTMYPKL